MDFFSRTKTIIYAVLFFAVIFVFIKCNFTNLPGLKKWNEERNQENLKTMEKNIKNNPKLRELDTICSNIPFVKRLTLIKKKQSHRKPTTLFIYYRSNLSYFQAGYEFRKHFNSINWEEIEDKTSPNTIEFQNKKFIASMQMGSIGPDANYGFTCGFKKK